MIKSNKLGFIALPLMALLIIPTISHAQGLGVNVGANVNINMGGRGGQWGPQGQNGPGRQGWDTHGNGTSTRPAFRGYATMGTITSISAPSFVIASRNREATTTYTVSTDANTVFQSGTSTIALSNLTVGANVVVSGTVSTSTNTIAATHVNIMGAMGPGMGNRGPGDRWNGTSTHATSTSDQDHKSFIGRCIDWLKKIF